MSPACRTLSGVRFRELFATRHDTITASLSPSLDPSTFPIATPWGEADLNRLIVEDIYGTDAPEPNSRSAAMRIPAVARARNLLVATGSRVPLHAFDADTQLEDLDFPWLFRTGTATTPLHRIAWTIDDLIFYGWSLWEKNALGDGGFPGAMDRVNRAAWTITPDNEITINGIPKKPDQVVLIPGLHEGILSYGVDAIRDTRRLYEVVRDRVENPIPAIDLHQVEGDDLTDAQRRTLLSDWRTARRSRGGAGVGFTNKAIEAKALGTGGSELLIEARNAAALDLARVVGVAASRIDSTVTKASLNYETTTGRNQELVDFDLALYLLPIAARLSMDDVVPPGIRTAHDFTDLVGLTPSLTGPPAED